MKLHVQPTCCGARILTGFYKPSNYHRWIEEGLNISTINDPLIIGQQIFYDSVVEACRACAHKKAYLESGEIYTPFDLSGYTWTKTEWKRTTKKHSQVISGTLNKVQQDFCLSKLKEIGFEVVHKWFNINNRTNHELVFIMGNTKDLNWEALYKERCDFSARPPWRYGSGWGESLTIPVYKKKKLRFYDSTPRLQPNYLNP